MKGIKVVVFIIIAAGVVWGAMQFNANLDQKAQVAASAAQQQAAANWESAVAKLVKNDVAIGQGTDNDAVRAGDQITIDYIGTLDDGTKFDSSYDRKQPMQFTLGAKQVIDGFDLGIVGMKPHGKRNLTIPPELGYGAKGVTDQQTGKVVIPPNATLHFLVELKSFLRISPAGTSTVPAAGNVDLQGIQVQTK